MLSGLKQGIDNAASAIEVCVFSAVLRRFCSAFHLVRAYHVGATDPGKAGYQSVLSKLTAAVAGKGVFYYITIGSILLALALSANTAFADFP